MEQGFYTFELKGPARSASGTMLIGAGKLTGFDMTRCRYDGTYVKRPNGALTVQMRVTVPAETTLVTGGVPERQEHAVDWVAPFPADFGAGAPVTFTLRGHSVQLVFQKMRDL
jgi:hypothetical protein